MNNPIDRRACHRITYTEVQAVKQEAHSKFTMKAIATACLVSYVAAIPAVSANDWFDEFSGGGNSGTVQPDPGNAYGNPSVIPPSQPCCQNPVPPTPQARKERSALTLAITQAVAGSLAGVIADLVGTLGRMLINWLITPSQNKPNDQVARVSKMSKSEIAAKAVSLPSLGISNIMLLKDRSPGAEVLNSSLPLEKVDAPDGWPNYRITMRTNDIYAFNFTTSIPGLAKLYNVNSQRQSKYMSTYEALPFGDNRVPKQRGILLHGTPEVEYLVIEFTPCMPYNYMNDSRFAEFKANLSVCKAEENSQAAKSLNPSAKAMTDLDAEASNAGGLLGTLPGYQAGQTTRVVLEVNHLAN